MGIRKQMSTFDFILMLVFQCKEMESINVTSKTLQKENLSLDEATNLLEKSLEGLEKIRTDDDVIVEQAKQLLSDII